MPVFNLYKMQLTVSARLLPVLNPCLATDKCGMISFSIVSLSSTLFLGSDGFLLSGDYKVNASFGLAGLTSQDELIFKIPTNI
jgi:hypothetical protein